MGKLSFAIVFTICPKGFEWRAKNKSPDHILKPDEQK
jgi:hypothetical protein